MPILKICTKYSYPERGTKNGRIYPPDVLKEAFSSWFFKEQCDRHFIPVRDEADEFLGYATARLESENTVIVEVDVYPGPYIDILKELEDDSFGFILAGHGEVDHQEDKDVVLKADFDRVILTKNPAVDFTTKIDRDNIINQDRYRIAPWITDDFGYNDRFRTKLIE